MSAETSEKFKIVIIGNSAVGKTSLMRVFNSKQKLVLGVPFITTIGVDFVTKKIVLGDGRKVRLQIWDTAGQEKYQTLTKSYFRDADGVLVCYAVDDPESFEKLPSWIDSCQNALQSHDGKETASEIREEVAIIATKCDLPEDEWKVPKEKGESFAAQHGYQFLATSSVDGSNVDKTFYSMAERGLQKKAHSSLPTAKSSFRLGPSAKAANIKKQCCS